MKSIYFFAICLFMALFGTTDLMQVHGQNTATNPCDQLDLDFENGTLNGVNGTASMEEVKKSFPCFTGETEENTSGSNCGGGVFFLDHDFFIYTGRDYLNVRKKFKGKTTKPVLGQSIEAALKLMGEPDSSFVYTDEFFGDKTTYLQYTKNWGTLVLKIKENSVDALELHYGKKIGEIEFCF